MIDAHLRAQPPTAATRAGPKAQSDALLPTAFGGVGGAATTLRAKPSDTPTRSSEPVTYRLRNSAAAAAAPRPSLAAAAILA